MQTLPAAGSPANYAVIAPRGQIVRRECITLAPTKALADVFSRLMTSDQGCFPVLEHSRVVGQLTIENVFEFVAFRRVAEKREPVAARVALRNESEC